MIQLLMALAGVAVGLGLVYPLIKKLPDSERARFTPEPGRKSISALAAETQQARATAFVAVSAAPLLLSENMDSTSGFHGGGFDGGSDCGDGGSC